MSARPRAAGADRAYRAVVAVGTFLLWLLDARREVRGAEHVPQQGGVVLAISHFSYVDFVLSQWAIWCGSRRYTRFLATKASFDSPVSGWLMRAMGHVAVDRADGECAYRLAVSALRRGEIVGVFPESRVSGSFTLLSFKRGAARMAAESGCPIVPCVIWGSHRILTRTRAPSVRAARHRRVQITFGAPLGVTPQDDPAVITHELRQAMTQLLEEAMDRDRLDAGAWWVPAHRGGRAPSPDAQPLDQRKAS